MAGDTVWLNCACEVLLRARLAPEAVPALTGSERIAHAGSSRRERALMQGDVLEIQGN